MGPTPPERQSHSRKDTAESSALCYWKLRSNNVRDGNAARPTVGHTRNDEKTRKALHYIQDGKMCRGFLDGDWGDYLVTNREKEDSGKP